MSWNEEQRARYYAKHRDGKPNNRRRWSDDHDQLVKQHAVPDSQLGREIGRGVNAIQVRRSLLRGSR